MSKGTFGSLCVVSVGIDHNMITNEFSGYFQDSNDSKVIIMYEYVNDSGTAQYCTLTRTV